MKVLRDQFSEVMADLRGGITVEEAELLRRLASSVDSGCIVEIGAFRGKSVLALIAGALDRNDIKPVPIHSIDPHAEFVGYYGGQFGPVDRGAYYEAMLRFDGFRYAALVNLPSYQAAQGWRSPVSLLFIDGDHRYHQVREDFLAWDRHVRRGGLVAFDDATDTQCGPFAVIAEAVASGCYVKLEEMGKIVVLRKCADRPLSAIPAALRILVACHVLTASGGLLRFERLGRVLNGWGHQLSIVVMADDAATSLPGISIPVLSVEEASRMTWDVTMIPGAGFPDETIKKFEVFRDIRFGLRVQHVLNEQQLRPRFLLVNRSFRPDIVIFNNPGWPPGSFTEFEADRFHVLCGAVDPVMFAPMRRARPCPQEGGWIIGGLANKNPVPLVEALNLLPADCELRLFGADIHGLASSYPDLLASGRLKLAGMVYDEALARFYGDLDCVVMTEVCAGWSNLVAEALCSGVPTICTRHGTAVVAHDNFSALLIDYPDAEMISASG